MDAIQMMYYYLLLLLTYWRHCTKTTYLAT